MPDENLLAEALLADMRDMAQARRAPFVRESDLSWEGDLPVTAAAKPKAAPKEKGPTNSQQFFQDNPIHPDHIIAHWNAATAAEKDTGEHWYESAHHIAKAIAGGDAATGAGIVAAYSPQSLLATNYHNASRSIRAGRGLHGGKDNAHLPGYQPGMGMGATRHAASNADRILGGEHHSTVFSSPKLSNFAHLIEDPENHGNRVVVDRHALSVAVGRRVSDDEFSQAGLSADPRKGESVNRQYSLAADAYRVAAHKISQTEGRPIAPHQVQAVTWDDRRRLNDDQDRDAGVTDPKAKGRLKLKVNENAKWQSHVQQFYPEHADNPHFKMSSAPHLAYGETYVPQEVNTLRDTECKICSGTNFRGRMCVQCGYIQPPVPFADPDVDRASELNDLRNSVESEVGEVDPSRPDVDDEDDEPVATLKGS